MQRNWLKCFRVWIGYFKFKLDWDFSNSKRNKTEKNIYKISGISYFIVCCICWHVHIFQNLLWHFCNMVMTIFRLISCYMLLIFSFSWKISLTSKWRGLPRTFVWVEFFAIEWLATWEEYSIKIWNLKLMLI